MVDDSGLDGVPIAEQQREDPAPPVDTFWLQQAVEESTRPPPRPVRSISLGYIGDAPLTGGVMRDTPVDYQQRGGCSCALREPPPPQQ